MIIDCNVSLGHWPFQPLDCSGAAELAARLRQEGIAQAYVRSCQAALLPEPEEDNCRLQRQLEPYRELIAVPTLNPTLTGWDRMVDFRTTAAVNVYPGYHGYSPYAPEMVALAEKCLATATVLFVTMRQEDSRGAYRFCRVPDVEAEPLGRLAAEFPELNIVCLNSSVPEAVALLSGHKNIYADIAYLEAGDTMAKLIAGVSERQLLFGSHTPFFYTRAAVMKAAYGTMSEEARELLYHGNIERVMAGNRK